MESSSGNFTTRTNLAPNPSFEATIGTYDVRTNLAVNPSFETANGSVNVRTNLFNGSTMLIGAGATQITGVSYGGSSWTRLSTTTAGHGLRAYVNLADLVNGATYAAEWEVANDGASSVGINLDWCDTSTSGGFHTIAAGERKRIKVIGTKATYDATYRFADIGLSTENTNILFREILIEKDDISGPFFDGANPIQNLIANSSFDTDLSGWAVGTVGTRDTSKAYTGTASLKVDTSSSAAYTGVAITPALATGVTYTWSAYIWAPTGTTVNFAADAMAVNTSLVGNSQWQRVSLTGTATGSGSPLYIRSTVANQSAFWVDAVLLEKTATLNPYYSGQGDFTYVWAGTANASPSHQVGTGLMGVGPANQAAVFQTGSSGARAAKILFKGTTIVDSGLSFAGILTVAASKTYTVSADLTSNINRLVKFSAQGTGTVNQNSANISLTAGITSRQSWTFSTTATAPTSVALYVLRSDALLGTLSVDNMMIEEGTAVSPYFDGGTAAAGDFTYLWSGVANASTSIQRAPAVENLVGGTAMAVIQSKDWKLSGANSARVIPRTATQDTYGVVAGVTLETGKTYTISATCRLTGAQTTPESRARKIVVYHSATSHASSQAANAAGSTRLSVTFTVTDGAVYQSIRLYNGASQGNGDVWWDDLLIEETNTLRAYFDGTNAIRNLVSNPNFETNTTGWTSNHGNLAVSRDTSIFYSGTASLKGTWSISGVSGGLNNVNALMDVVEGQPITGSAWVRASQNTTFAVMLRFRNNAGASTGDFSGVGVVVGTSWVRISYTYVAPVGTTKVFIQVQQQSASVNGDSYWVDNIMVEKSDTLNAYYEDVGDYTYTWSGTANASTSLQRAPMVAGFTMENGGVFYRDSTSKLMSGTYSGKMLPSSGDIYKVTPTTVVGAAWTFSMDYMTAGTLTGNPRLYISGGGPATVVSLPLNQPTPTRVSVTLPETATGVTSVIAAIFGATTGEFWIDNVLIEQTSASLPYFDGSTPASGDFTYIWTGTAHASTSQQRAPGVSQVSTGNCWPIHSSEWSASGGKSLRLTGINQFNTSSALLVAPLEKGKTYTVLATRRLPAPLTGTLSSYAGSIISVQTGIGTFLSPSLPNVAGVAQARFTFKLDENSGAWTLRLGHGGTAGSGDVWWDNVMIVEGTYTGDYVDGSKPFSKWNGTANASTSAGYPPQLLDIAGKPFTDLSGIGDTGAINVDPFSARTIYFVYESTDINASWQAPLYYGVGGSNGITFQTNAAGVDSVAPRVDFSGGDSNRTFVSSSRGVGRRHVLAITFPQGIASAVANFNGGSDIAQTYTSVGTGWANGRVYTIARTGIAAVRTIVYYAEHNATTRQAVSRYLGNKYGANVA